MHAVSIADWSELPPLTPRPALVAGVDLVIVRYEEDGADQVSVLYGRCQHRGALLADGHVDGANLICGVHGWDWRFDTGVSEYKNSHVLKKFHAWVEDDQVWVDEEEVAEWERSHPQPYDRDAYQGAYADIHGSELEPHVQLIQSLAADGLTKFGHHGPSAAMGVLRSQLPGWDDLQVLTAQMATKPLLDDAPVGTELVIGPRAEKPLRLEIPLFVSDMSFGALSREAKIALASGAELAGTGICSGEGGMLPDEQAANSRYLYELASGGFGWSLDKVRRCQAFHFKGGQGAKTGTGGHLPGATGGQARDRRGARPEGRRSGGFAPDLQRPEYGVKDFKLVQSIAEVREAISGGVFRSDSNCRANQHVEDDIDFALVAGADYIILDGRGGGTGAAPLLFRDHISVPTIPALARARRHLDANAA